MDPLGESSPPSWSTESGLRSRGCHEPPSECSCDERRSPNVRRGSGAELDGRNFSTGVVEISPWAWSQMVNGDGRWLSSRSDDDRRSRRLSERISERFSERSELSERSEVSAAVRWLKDWRASGVTRALTSGELLLLKSGAERASGDGRTGAFEANASGDGLAGSCGDLAMAGSAAE